MLSILLKPLVLKHVLEDRLNGLGWDQWKKDVLEKIDLFSNDDVLLKKDQVSSVYSQLTIYERLEALALLELGVWKRKIDECKSFKASIAFIGRHTRKKAKIDRQSSRINCGADVVIFNVLPFLGKVEVEE